MEIEPAQQCRSFQDSDGAPMSSMVLSVGIGFVSPPVAMRQGILIVTERMPEVAGAGALYFDPRDSFKVASALERLGTEPDTRRVLQNRALRHSDSFPPASKMAKQTLAVIESAIRIAD